MLYIHNVTSIFLLVLSKLEDNQGMLLFNIAYTESLTKCWLLCKNLQNLEPYFTKPNVFCGRLMLGHHERSSLIKLLFASNFDSSC